MSNLLNSEYTPRVSVIMSVYKEPLDWMTEAIDSIITQTFRDFEFIIINDNPSRNELREFLIKYAQKDSRIKIIENKENIGLTKSLNKGLKISKGEYIARMDADDISLPTRFEKQIEHLDRNKYIVIVGSWVRSFGTRRNVVKYPENDTEIRIEQILSSPFDHPATMMRKSSIIKAGGEYDETIRYAQDQEFWYRLGKVGKFYNIQEILFEHRYSESQISKQHLIEQQRNVKSVRKLIIEDFYTANHLLLPNLGSVGINDIKNLDTHLDQLNLSQKEKKIGNAIIQSFLMSQSSYSLINLCSNVLLGKVVKWQMSSKQIIKYVIKTLFPKKFITNGIR